MIINKTKKEVNYLTSFFYYLLLSESSLDKIDLTSSSLSVTETFNLFTLSPNFSFLLFCILCPCPRNLHRLEHFLHTEIQPEHEDQSSAGDAGKIVIKF